MSRRAACHDTAGRFRVLGRSDDDYQIFCECCGIAETAERDDTGERVCISGWCEDSEVACDECGLVGCDCDTERTWVMQAIACACRHRGLLWGQVVEEYRKRLGVDALWRVGLRGLCDLLLEIVTEEAGGRRR